MAKVPAVARVQGFFIRVPLLAVLSVAVIGLFLVTFYHIYHAPLYIDEPMWLLQNARLPYDGFRMINLFPMCTSNFTWEVPWVMWPGRLFASALHPDSYVGLRLIGMGKYLLCLAILSGIAWLHYGRVFPPAVLVAGVISVLSLGVLPLLMIFTRPESAVFIGAGLLYLIMAVSRRTGRAVRQYALAGAFLLVLSWFLSLHPKSQFFLPAVLLMAFGLRLPMRHLRVLFVLFVVFMGAEDYRLWKVHPTCPNWSPARFILSHHTLVPQTLKDSPRLFFRIMAENLSKAKIFYLDSVTFQRRYWVDQRSWLEWFDPGRGGGGHAGLANRLIHGTLLMLAAAAALALVAVVNRHGMSVLFRPLPAGVAVWLCCAAAMQMAIKRGSTMYETPMIWPVLFLAVVLLIAQGDWLRKYREIAACALSIMMVTAILSNIVFIQQLRPYLLKMGDPYLHHNGYLPSGLISVQQGIFDHPEREGRILEAAGRCGIARDQSVRRLVIDEFTYLPFRKTYQPFYGTYLFLWGPKGRQLMQFIERRGSSGVVALCRKLPWVLQRHAIRHEGICCINFERLWGGPPYRPLLLSTPGEDGADDGGMNDSAAPAAY